MSNTTNTPKVHGFQAILSQRCSEDSGRDLRLSLVSLRKSQTAIGMYIAESKKNSPTEKHRNTSFIKTDSYCSIHPSVARTLLK